MAELVYQPNVKGVNLALLTGDNQQPNIQGILTAWLVLAQELEDTIWAVYESRILANASNAQLDLLGAIVGCLRNNLGDSDYRTAIKIQIAVNKSKGRGFDLVGIGVLAGVSPVYVQTSPGHFQITVQAGILPVASAFSKAKAAGTNGDMISTLAGTQTFYWDTLAGGYVAPGWDDVADTLAIGKWCEVTPV